MDYKRITFENITDLYKGQNGFDTYIDKSGEERIVTKVNRAELACIIAFFVGVNDERLDTIYGAYYKSTLDKLRADRQAMTIRYLSRIRTSFFRYFGKIDSDLLYNLTNIDRLPDYFKVDEVKSLIAWSVPVIKTNTRSDKYVVHINNLIDENIDYIKKYIPDNVKFEYVRELFVVPNANMMKQEHIKFQANKNAYPFQNYIYWNPDESAGYLFYSDVKFLNIIYEQHNMIFDEADKFRDASDDTKNNIYSFIDNAERIVIAVDCENSDPYKLYGILKNLSEEKIKHIDKILLYDDKNTTDAWDYISQLVNIPVEHIVIDRIVDNKSLVDIKMSVGVTTAHYRDNVDSFIICSSDSDFWGLISSLPTAKFIVLYENAKCGAAIKEALINKKIFNCSMDDFYIGNAGELQDKVLLSLLESHLSQLININGRDMVKQIYRRAYIQGTSREMDKFFEKYIRSLRLKVDIEGNFHIATAGV